MTLKNNQTLIVAIGASAGGLEPLLEFFSLLDRKKSKGIAYVVIQHLSPNFKSVMPELIGRVTDISVSVVSDGLKIKPDNIYLIPQSKNMFLKNGAFSLLSQDREHGVLNLPISLFLSLCPRKKKSVAWELFYQEQALMAVKA